MDEETLKSLGIDEDKIASILGLHNDDVKGLKSKNEQLIGENKGFRSKFGELESAAEEARQIAAEKEEARLKAEGDQEGLRKHYETQLADKTALLKAESEKAQNALLSRDKSVAQQQILSRVDERFRPFAEKMLSDSINVTYKEDGAAQYSFIDNGQEVANNVESFIGWAENNPTWQSVLSAPQSSGGGANNTGGGAASDPDAAYKQRLKDAGLT